MGLYKRKSIEEQKNDVQRIETLRNLKNQGFEGNYFKCLININKLGLKGEDLSNAEREITNLRMYDLGREPLSGNFDVKHLQEYHKRLFGDIYYFAGELRDVYMEIDPVTVFVRPEHLPGKLDDFFNRLKKDNLLKGLKQNEFTSKMADYLTDINILHPFREGNGRSKRTFFRALANQAGYSLDWSAKSAAEWRLADEAAFDSSRDGCRDTTYLKMLLGESVQLLASATERQSDAAQPRWSNLAKPTTRSSAAVNIKEDFSERD